MKCFVGKRDSCIYCGFSCSVKIEKYVPVTHTSHETSNLIIYILSIHAILLTYGSFFEFRNKWHIIQNATKRLERFRYQSRKRIDASGSPDCPRFLDFSRKSTSCKKQSARSIRSIVIAICYADLNKSTITDFSPLNLTHLMA